MVKLKYSDISNYQFSQAIQKIAATPLHGNAKSVVHKTVKALQFARDKLSKQYAAEIIEVFGKRGEDGKLVRPEGEPNGFEPDESKEKEFMDAQEAFGKNVTELNCKPFTDESLDKMAISAQDLAALGALYVGNAEEEAEKPPVPLHAAS